MSIGLQKYIDPEDWDKNKQRPKSSIRGRNDLVLLKKEVEKWEAAVYDLYHDTTDTLTNEQFRQEILYRVGAEERPGELPKELHAYVADFIDRYKQRPGVTRTGWGKFESLQNHLKQFEQDTKQRLDFNSIDYQFKEEFTAWMFAPPRNFANNNASKIIGSLRQIMQDGFLMKVHTNAFCNGKGLVIRRNKTNSKVRLTVPELYAIEHYDFTDAPHLDRTRDLLIFACWTGLRVSDWHKIGRANFQERGGRTYIHVITQKTTTPVIIPVVPQVERIFEKYDYLLPRPAQPVFNRQVKDVCWAAIPESTFERMYSKGGKTQTERAPKWKYVSSHSGRKSFASNMYEATGRAYPIMQITGHTTEATFQKYVDLKRADTVKTLHPPALELARWTP